MLSRDLLSRLGKTSIIYPAALLQSVAYGTINLGFVFHLRGARGLEPATIGLFVSFAHVCYLVACLALPAVLGRILPRRAMLTASLACTLLAVAMVASPSLPLVFVLSGLFGASQALFWPPVVGWLSTGTEGPALGRAVARFNISWSIGAVASPWIGGSLSEIAGSVAMLTGGAASAVVAALLAAASRLIPSIRDDRHTESRVEAVEGAEDRSTPVRFPAWVGVAVAWLLMGVLFTAFPIYATEELGFTRTLVGTLLLVRALFAAVVFGAMGRWSFWQFRGTPMVVAQVLLAATAAVLALARSPLAVGATLGVIGALGATAYVESVFHGVAGSLQRARRMAIHEALLTVGTLGGALGGGWVYQARGMPFVLVSYTVLLLAAAAAQVAMLAPLRRARLAGAAPRPR
jgi:MFS family permease